MEDAGWPRKSAKGAREKAGLLTRRRVADNVATVKTTVDIDETVLRQAEKQAEQAGKPLATLVEEALRASLGMATPAKCARRRLQRMPDGTYFNPNGIPNDDAIFKILEDIEAERHRTPGPLSPDFS